MNSLNILASTQVPNPTALITGRARKYGVMRRVPRRLICNVIMSEAANWLHLGRDCCHVPQLDCAVVRGRDRALLVQVVPLAALNLRCMPAQDSQRLLRVLNRPEPQGTVATGRQKFISICLTEADVKGRVRSRNLHYRSHLHSGCRRIKHGYLARAKHSKVLSRGHSQNVLYKGTKSRRHIRREDLPALIYRRRVEVHLYSWGTVQWLHFLSILFH